MEIREAMNEVLNDLVKINNDRIAGYEKAIAESNDLDIDLRAIFDGMIKESAQYKFELAKKIEEHDGTVEDDTTPAGKIYRAWMDIKSTLTESDRHSILASCEFLEDAAQRAYDAALASEVLYDPYTRQLVGDEQAALKKSHELIKKQREAHKMLAK
jgi:uncharacterized protein (TIGR02284 family)